MYCTKFAKRTLAIMVACAIAAPALAADEPPVINSFVDALENGKPMTNFRLRYEHVDDANPAHTDNADAWTLRSLIGWQTAPFHDFSVAVQLINVTQLNDQFYDGSNGVFGSSSAIPLDKRKYPVVGDPDYTNVNQAYIEWTGLKGTAVRLGRQSVKLDNVRFIGNVEFRQVMQVFDGIAVENKGLLPDTSIYLAHFGGLQQTSTKYRSANVEIANVKYNFSPTESIGGYGYFIDWNHKTDVTNANPYNEDNSNRTLGLRLDGAHGINDDWKVLYTAEYAKQDDYKDGLSKIDAHYLKFG
ncbi:MAG: alginate export family protein, partial [Methylobacillus sp.]|nr:alginate export family protein [Methylobacillus sp.]